MAEVAAREAKLIQYLNEAYGKERELETSLQAHIAMTSRDGYNKRLREHLRETKQHAKNVERRIKQLGGKAETAPLPGPDAVAGAAGAVQAVAQKAVAASKGPLHAVRGTSEPETMLKNAKTEYWNEHDEIANYRAIEALADAVGDRDTAKLAKQHRRDEERMAKFLEKTIDQLTKDVVRTEIPAKERRGSSSRSRSSSRRKSSSRSSASGRRASASRSSASGRKASTRSSASGRKASSARSSSGRKASTSRSSSSGRKASSSRSSASGRKASSSRSSASGRRTSSSRASSSGRKTSSGRKPSSGRSSGRSGGSRSRSR